MTVEIREHSFFILQYHHFSTDIALPPNSNIEKETTVAPVII
jgi:hypothetical protein